VPDKDVDLLAVAADIARQGDAAMTRYESDKGMNTVEVSGMEAVIGLNDPGTLVCS